MTYWGDDCNSLCMLLQSEDVYIDGIITTSGNAWENPVRIDVHRILSKFGYSTIPVYPGLPVKSHSQRQIIYREIEVGTYDYCGYAGALGMQPPVAKVNSSKTANQATAFINATVLAAPNQVSLINIGPLSVLAALLNTNPKLIHALGQVIIMGGNLMVKGNTTDNAEFNFWFDPESAQTVLQSGIKATLIPLDCVNNTPFADATIARLHQSRQPMARHISEYFNARKQQKPTRATMMIDEIAVGCFLKPELIQQHRHANLSIDITHGKNYGNLIITDSNQNQDIKVVTKINTDALNELFCNLIAD